MSTVNSNQVLDALRKDPTFGQPDAFNELKGYVGQLPEIVGAKRMDDQVTLRGMLDITGELIQYMLDEDYGKDLDDLGVTRMTLANLVENIKKTDVQGVLRQRGTSERELLLDDDSQFNDEAKQLYAAGELTYARLLTVNPAALLRAPDTTRSARREEPAWQSRHPLGGLFSFLQKIISSDEAPPSSDQ